MRVYRLFNHSEHAQATQLHFLDRASAEKYIDTVRWPYENLTYYQLPDGSKIPLKDLDVRVEVVEMPGTYDTELDCIITERDGELGHSDIVPGKAFNPDDWLEFTIKEWMNDKIAPRLDAAETAIRESSKMDKFMKDRWKERGAKGG